MEAALTLSSEVGIKSACGGVRRCYLYIERRPEFHEGTSEGRILGDGSFVERAYEKSEQCEGKSETLDEIIQRVGKEYGLTEAVMVATGRQG